MPFPNHRPITPPRPILKALRALRIDVSEILPNYTPEGWEQAYLDAQLAEFRRRRHQRSRAPGRFARGLAQAYLSERCKLARRRKVPPLPMSEIIRRLGAHGITVRAPRWRPGSRSR
jgi:hypothetical protein